LIHLLTHMLLFSSHLAMLANKRNHAYFTQLHKNGPRELIKQVYNMSFFISYPLSALVHISSLEPIGSRTDIMT